MNWRIESRQQSVAGLGGHNYLALIKPDGGVVDQIHGHNLDGRLVYARSLGQPEVHGAEREIVAGSEPDIMREWNKMQAHAQLLGGDPKNGDYGARAVYGLLGPNSNSLWATVLQMSGYDPRQHEPASDHWTPGTGIDISDPQWWLPEYRWPGTTVPNERDETTGVLERLP